MRARPELCGRWVARLAALLFTLAQGCSCDTTGAPCLADDQCPQGQHCDAAGTCRAGEAPPSRLQELEIVPAALTAPRGSTQAFTARGRYVSGSSRDLTALVTWESSDATVLRQASGAAPAGTFLALAKGTATVTATLERFSASASVTVGDARLSSLAVSPASGVVAKGDTRQLVATGTFSDGLEQELTGRVTWASSAPSIVAISNSPGTVGLLTANALGTAMASATLDGVTGSTSVMVTPAALRALALTPGNPQLPRGITQQLTATGTYSDNSSLDLTSSVSWSSSAEATVRVSNEAGSRGRVAALEQGVATVTATLGELTGNTLVSVLPPALTAINLTPTSTSIARGTQTQFLATGTYSDDSTQDLTSSVSWSSSNTGVATVSNAPGSRGLASGLSPGVTQVTATLSGLSGPAGLTVTSATLESIALAPANPMIPIGAARQLTATGIFSDGSTQDLTASATWASADGSRASVSKGLVTGLAVGTSLITATFLGTSGTTTATVTGATLQSIAVTPTSPSVAKGTTQQLAATATYSDASTQDVTSAATWASSNPAVASVSTTGLASGLATGSSTISASLNGRSGTTTVTVTSAVLQAIAVTPTTPSIAKGSTQQFLATGTFSDNTTQNVTTTATWASSQPAVATVSNAAGSQGVATAVATGTATVSATLSGLTGGTVLTVSAATLSSLAVTPASPSIAKGTTKQFTAIATYSDSTTQDVTGTAAWTSSNVNVATVSAAGLATGVNPGSSTTTATLSGKSDSTTLTVTSASLQSIAVTPANPSVPAGNQRPFTATGTYSDGSTQDITTTVTWASSNASLATISNAAGSKGVATGVAQGSVTITATLSNVTGSTGLTIGPPVLESIVVSPNPASLRTGSSQQFTARGTYSDGSTAQLTGVTWASSDTIVAWITGEGLAIAQGVGSTTITATLGAQAGSSTLTVTTF